MTQTQFSLSWEAHKRNICAGLGSLQQNAEFVDMTLAADGHFVKVHQVIIALASPYLKQLITSVQCQHPIIFLNKISFGTLSAILEYIYTGEVLVSVENLSELIEAGRELHIKGLEDMVGANKQHQPVHSTAREVSAQSINTKEEILTDDGMCYFEISAEPLEDKSQTGLFSANDSRLEDETQAESMQLDDTTFDETEKQENHKHEQRCETTIKKSEDITSVSKKTVIDENLVSDANIMQYTVSNQGNLQIILNRFLYYLKHTNRDGTHQWRCVDYLTPSRCPAIAITRNDVVLQRLSSHTHSFHDKKILKKVQAGAIFSAINEAEQEGASKKRGFVRSDSIIEDVSNNVE